MKNLKGYNALMETVCVKLGFCGCIKKERPLHVDDLIPSEGIVHADQFVEWVFLADDQNPNSDLEKWQQCKNEIRQAFIECMGSATVDVKLLQYK